jgi:CheY-like chemotaxis protein
VGRTILVADDSAAIQKRASGILAGEGLEVLTVSNGVAAIKKLSLLKPLLILADVSMPGKDGYEVCEFVKTNPELAYIPILLLVSDLEPYDEGRGAMVRADGMVQKPFDPGKLISVVTKFVAQAEAALAQAQVADTVINPAAPTPEFSVETPPVEEEQAPAPKSEALDWGALPEGAAFAEPALYETSTPPPEPMFGAPPPHGSYEAAPPEPQYEWSPEAVAAMEGRPAAETAPEPLVAPGAHYGEPARVEDAPVAAVGAVPAVPEVGYPEPAPVEAPEEVAPVPSEPVFIEEAAPAVSEPEASFRPEMTMMFRAPVEIAEPVLMDELAPAPPAEEPPPAVEPEVPPVAAEPEVVSAPVAEFDSSPVAEETPAPVEAAPAVEAEAAPAAEEAAVSPVESAPPAEEAAPEWSWTQPTATEELVPESVETPSPVAQAQPTEVAALESVEIPSPVGEAPPAEVAVEPVARASVLDPDWVYWIVRTVVVKMSPPAFSNEAIEDMARKITDEITAELDSYSSQG